MPRAVRGCSSSSRWLRSIFETVMSDANVNCLIGLEELLAFHRSVACVTYKFAPVLMNLPFGCFLSFDNNYTLSFWDLFTFAFSPGPSSQLRCQWQRYGSHASIWRQQREQVRKKTHPRSKRAVLFRPNLNLGCGFGVWKQQSAKCSCIRDFMIDCFQKLCCYLAASRHCCGCHKWH